MPYQVCTVTRTQAMTGTNEDTHSRTYQVRILRAERCEFARQAIDRRGDHRVAGGGRARGEQRGDEGELGVGVRMRERHGELVRDGNLSETENGKNMR
jgi:hypothetical protein